MAVAAAVMAEVVMVGAAVGFMAAEVEEVSVESGFAAADLAVTGHTVMADMDIPTLMVATTTTMVDAIWFTGA